MSREEIARFFEDCPTRVDPDCLALRRRSRIRRIRSLAFRTLHIAYLSLPAIAIVAMACK